MKGLAACCVVLMLIAFPARAAEPEAALHEDFDTLAAWRPLTFPKISRHTVYSITLEGTNRVLKAEARASASGLVLTNGFDVTRYPVLRWSWKAANVYTNGDATHKSGDDYPIRLYVIFKYDPEHAGMGTRAKRLVARSLYGADLPDSTLSYIWANRSHGRRMLPSPYTDRAMLVVLRAGTNDLGRWVEESVNILDDYRAAFGKDPPREASLAIMSDADNTGESATAYVDRIELLSNTNTNKEKQP